MSSRQPISKSIFSQRAFSIASKTLPNKDIATIEDAVKDLEKEEADMICVKINLTLQNSKLFKDKPP